MTGYNTPGTIEFQSKRLYVEFNGITSHSNLSSKFLKDLRLYRTLKKSQVSRTSYGTYTALPYYMFPDKSLAFLLDYFEYNTNVNLSNPDSFVITNLLPKVRIKSSM